LQINPVGYDTTYHLDYGPTTSYGSEIPVGGEDIGSGIVPVPKTIHLENLPSGTIHYRVIATNQWGTTATDDTTFNFRPPPCPNAHVRQQTDSSYLPDCRAYELVTPGYAGAVQIMPGEALTNFGSTFGSFPQAPQNYGFATSPSRFVYMGGLGSVEGQEAPNALLDMYLANRTDHGWVTTFPSIKGYEAKFTYGFGCSESMDFCVSFPGESTKLNPETNENERIPPSESPYLYQADGSRIARLPTNVTVIPGGIDFDGDKRLSGDFSHFVFSTTTQFTPGADTEAPGTVYDNDIQAKTVVPISHTESGEPIPEIANDGKLIRPTGIADVSRDGSHILMAATTHEKCSPDVFPFKCEYALKAPALLYMSINDIAVKDVSRGKLARFVGMTKNGSKVLFTTTEPLLPQDHDTSADMYMWSEEGNSLQLISQQGNLGNSDNCSATWIEKCGVEAMYPSRVVGSEAFDDAARVPGLDDQIAYENGDVYFYSPEDLVPGEVGADGQRNLYLFHEGHLQLVTTFEPGTQVDRVTISGDGSHAAFMTKSSLTSYNSGHHNEVYAYDAVHRVMRCASCNPNGTPPMTGETVVTVSESGPFMSNDGRVFFGTKESLVPQDTDGIRDVYEYTEGRPQLISSGTGDRESTGGSEQIGAFFGDLQTGLESVSRDGTNVYFSTFETLVPEDKNGSFLKIYDARTGGGFDFNPELGQCAAADECHGEGSQAPPPAQVATGGGLGASGNLPASRGTAKKKHKKHHKRKHHRGKRAVNGDRSHGNG
jgi:guanyl-specific ribonuclease Sa